MSQKFGVSRRKAIIEVKADGSVHPNPAHLSKPIEKEPDQDN